MSYSDILRKWEDGSDFIEMKTSGSTGRPKTIKIEKQRMEASARMSLAYFKLAPNDRVLLALPTDKIGGAMLAVRAIVGKLAVIEVEPRLNPFREVSLESIDFCSLTPAQLNAILQEEDSAHQLTKIDKILLGGSDVSMATLAQIKKLRNTFYHSYGMTETISHVAIKNLSRSEEYFSALDGVSFSTNEAGQLIIDAPEILSEPLLTNDVVALHGPKKMKWLGRMDNVVNSGGVKLLVEVIENKIRNFFEGDFYLTKEPDELLGERLVMISKKEVDKDVFLRLDKIERPKKVAVFPTFQYTENGKLLRLTPQQLKDL